MVTGSFRVAALDASTWPAYRALIELNNGVFGGCWCLGFHTEGAAKGQVRTFETKRELKHARVLAGTTHAALVFDGDDCVGWAQFGTPAAGWSFNVVLTGQDGFSDGSARTFAPTPQPFNFGVCAAGNPAPICSFDPNAVPKAVDVITPDWVSQATELDPTLGPVVVRGVPVP